MLVKPKSELWGRNVEYFMVISQAQIGYIIVITLMSIQCISVVLEFLISTGKSLRFAIRLQWVDNGAVYQIATETHAY